MKFFKGMVVGTLMSTGVMMMMNDNIFGNKNLKKAGKKLIKKVGKIME